MYKQTGSKNKNWICVNSNGDHPIRQFANSKNTNSHFGNGSDFDNSSIYQLSIRQPPIVKEILFTNSSLQTIYRYNDFIFKVQIIYQDFLIRISIIHPPPMQWVHRPSVYRYRIVICH